MAKAKVRKVGIKMLRPSTEWKVTASIPVYGWRAAFTHDPQFGGWKRDLHTQNISKQIVRTLTPGITLQVLGKAEKHSNFNVIPVTIKEEPNSLFYLGVEDMVTSVAPGDNVCEYRIMHVDGSFFGGLKWDYPPGQKYGRYFATWLPMQAGSAVFIDLPTVRNEAIRITDEYLLNHCNANAAYQLQWGVTETGVRSNELMIARVHVLTGDVLEKFPLVVI